MSGKKKNKNRQVPASEVVKNNPVSKKADPVKKTGSKNKNSWMKWVVFVLPVIIYANTLGNSYSMDDDLVTTESQKITTQGISALPTIFTTLYSENDTQAYEYRPVVLAAFALKRQF